MAITNLGDLFVHTLKDVAHAERQLMKALPKIARQASDPALKDAIALQHDQVAEQIGRLDAVFSALGESPRGVRCDAVAGLIDEAESLMDKVEDAPTMDLGLAAIGRAINQYKIARYDALAAWADRLGHDRPAALLRETLREGQAADGALSRCAGARSDSLAA